MTLTGPSGAGAVPTISPWSAPAPAISPRPAVAAISDPLPVVVRALAGAVAAQRPVRPRRVGPLEDPVLPGGEPAEDLRFAGFRAGEAEVGLHPGQRVRREAGPLLDHQPDLVRAAEEPDLQPAQAAAHRQQPGIEVVQPEHRRPRQILVSGEDAVQHVLP